MSMIAAEVTNKQKIKMPLPCTNKKTRKPLPPNK